jgi:hypothetical protein
LTYVDKLLDSGNKNDSKLTLKTNHEIMENVMIRNLDVRKVKYNLLKKKNKLKNLGNPDKFCLEEDMKIDFKFSNQIFGFG